METTPQTTPPRPLRNAPQLIHNAAELLLPDVMQWLNDASKPEHVLDDLKLAIRHETDGYAIARSIEQNTGITPDSELVEILDRAGSCLRTAYFNACAAWVVEHHLTGPAIGAQVKCTTLPNAVTGEIIRNDKDGRSLVYIEAHGHVREGFGCRGTYLPWETLTTI